MDSDDLASHGRAATLIADDALSPVDLLEFCLARIAAGTRAVEDDTEWLAVVARYERVLDFKLLPSM